MELPGSCWQRLPETHFFAEMMDCVRLVGEEVKLKRSDASKAVLRSQILNQGVSQGMSELVYALIVTQSNWEMHVHLLDPGLKTKDLSRDEKRGWLEKNRAKPLPHISGIEGLNLALRAVRNMDSHLQADPWSNCFARGLKWIVAVLVIEIVPHQSFLKWKKELKGRK
mgnify:CR=1 FL=1